MTNAPLPKVLVIGPVPPPFHGPAVGTRALLNDARLTGRFGLLHLDTTDRRPMGNMGRLDLVNAWLAVKHAALCALHLVADRPALVYIPISQNALAFLRDALLLLPAILVRRKLVIHLHGSDFKRFYATSAAPLRMLVRFIFRHTARVIVLGDNLRPIFDGLIPADRVVTVPNGVNGAPFDRLRSTAPKAPADGLQVTYLGNLTQGKGYRQLLAAIPQVLEHVPKAHFNLAGAMFPPAGLHTLNRYRLEPVIAGAAAFLGTVSVDAKIQLLLDSDVFVFPPVQPEGQPMVLLEAMAAGLPIVTTDQGAICETVLDGVQGFIVPASDPQALAEKITLLLQDESLRRRMGQASLQRFRAHYTLERWADDMAQVFQQVLAGP